MSETAVSQWPRFEPEISPFFDAADEGRLVLKRCRSCERAHFYPRAHCPHCFSAETEWFEAEGTGTIYTYSVLRLGKQPRVVAYVELAEGPRMLTNIVDCDPASVAIGQKVRVTFRPAPDGVTVPVFTLSDQVPAQ